MSGTNRSFPVGFNYEQGVGFSEYTGYWPMPEMGTGVLKIVDDNDYPRVLVLDHSTGKWYDVSLRDGPTGYNLSVSYKDKVSIDGTGGYDIEPSVKLKDHTGEYEKFITEHLSSRFYLRPIKEENRDKAGYDSLGYPSGIKFNAKVYIDGEPVNFTAETKDLNKTGEIVYDKKLEGRRLKTEFSADKSGFILTSSQIDYITKDINYDIDSRITTEGDHQVSLSEPISWFSRGETPTVDRVTGLSASGSVAYQAGPDTKNNSAFTITTSCDFGSVTDNGAKTVVVWFNHATPASIQFSIGGVQKTLTKYDDNGGTWNLMYASGVTGSGIVSINPSGSTGIFDLRIYSGNKSTDLEYLFDDVIKNKGDNICPLF